MKRFFILCTLYFVSLSLSAEIKYIFYFIGDGMGTNQVLSAEMYRSAIQGEPLGRVQTLMTTFPYSGHASTYSKSNGITDSAAAGTCLATGSKTTNGTLGLDADGNRLTTIAEELKAQGWGIGIMTTVAIDHATPAAFYAHVKKRSDYYKIGKQLCSSDFDFFGGAGFHHPQGKHDDKSTNLYRLAEKSGYTIVRSVADAQQFLNPKSEILNTPILACNVDILSNIDIRALIAQYEQTGVSQLVVSERQTRRYLLFDEQNLLRGWTNIATGEVKPSSLQGRVGERLSLLAFSGMQILTPEVLSRLDEMEEEKFSLIDFYLHLCEQNSTPSAIHHTPLQAYVPKDYKMMDVGKIDQIQEAERFAESL